jgi:hypothetical protein
LQNFEQRIEPLVAVLPEFPVVLEPIHGFPHRAGFDFYRPARSVPAPADETGAFEDLEMFGYRRLADREGFGQFVDGVIF